MKFLLEILTENFLRFIIKGLLILEDMLVIVQSILYLRELKLSIHMKLIKIVSSY